VKRRTIGAAAVIAVLAATPALAATTWNVDTVPQPTGADFTSFGGAFVASSKEAFAVGSQRQSNSSNFTQLIEEFNGGSFSIVNGATIPGASGSSLNSAGGSGPNDVWAVGSQSGGSNGALIEHFNGTSFSNVTSPTVSGGDLVSVSADSPTDAWTVGGQVITEPHNTLDAPLAEHWNGSSFSVVSTPITPVGPSQRDELVSVVAISPTDAWAIILMAQGREQSSEFEQWNGSTWTAVANPAGGILNGLSATGPNDVWAVGNNGLIEHFNGTSWSQVSNPAGSGENLASVSALSPTDEWTVSIDGTLTEQGNGASFTSVPTASPLPSSLRISSVSGISGGPLFAVGSDNGGNSTAVLRQPRP